AHPDDFDVVITDVSMPQLSGTQFAEELLQIRPNIPIIMMTGHIRPEDQEAARRLRINDVVRKPTTLEEFAQMLARCMENPQSGNAQNPS
ncbi:MAG: response regulator, partial [Steroidobacteraceae bacterium]